MKTIQQSTMSKTYGIDLPKGKYKIIPNGNGYDVYSIKDDTCGCLLTGYYDSITTNVTNSTKAFWKVYDILNQADDEIWLTVCNN